MIRDVLEFWFRDGRNAFRKAWFERDEAFDAGIRARFGDLVVPAARAGSTAGPGRRRARWP